MLTKEGVIRLTGATGYFGGKKAGTVETNEICAVNHLNQLICILVDF